MTVNTVVVFSLVMGALWLATVPLTSGLVAHIYGLRYMGTLYGIVFFSHQLGSFMGVWLGGKLYDQFGGYDIVWWVGIAVGVLSAIIHLPIREAPGKNGQFGLIAARRRRLGFFVLGRSAMVRWVLNTCCF